MKIRYAGRIAALATALLFLPYYSMVLGREGTGQKLMPDPQYSGSEKCGECHKAEYNYWKLTPHAAMARAPDWEESELLKQLLSEGIPFPREKVDLVIGNLKVLVFLTSKGQEFVALPRQYNVYMERWEAFTEDEWEPRLGESEKPLEEGPVNWNERCAGCHTTGYDPGSKRYLELSVGCEECHGPGARHSHTERKDDIINPKSLPHDNSISICGQCHSRGVSKDGIFPFPATFIPGDLLSQHFDILQPDLGTNTTAFWGNGMARRHHQQYQEFIKSKHNRMGLTCLDCHEGHRFKLKSMPKSSMALWSRTKMALLASRTHSICIRCHMAAETEFIEFAQSPGTEASSAQLLERHSHHPLVLEKRKRTGVPPVKAKLLCNDCHMPMTAPQEFGYPMHTHAFRVPSPKSTLRYGVANACNECHFDKTVTWALEKYLALWVLSRENPQFTQLMVQFEDVKAEYLRFSSFMSDTSPARREKLRSIDSLYQHILAIGERLQYRLDETESDTLAGEVFGEGDDEGLIGKLSEFSRLTSTCEEEAKAELLALVDADALAALNHILRLQQLPEHSLPPFAETYGKNAAAFLAFNRTVEEKGQLFFENAGRHTSWKTWVGIHKALLDMTYRVKPEHDISELEQMGLITRSVMLKERK